MSLLETSEYFCRTMMFPKALRREVLFLLVLKMAALALIYAAFFQPEHKPEPDSIQMRTHILGDGLK